MASTSGARRGGVRLPRAQRRRQVLHDADDRLRVPAHRRRAAHPRPGPGSRRPARSGPGSASCPQQDTLDPELTVLENLTVYARYFGIPRRVARERADGAARLRAAHRAGRRQGRAAVRRHEAPADDRPRAGQRARDRAARRADHRPRPAGPAPGVGAAVPAQAAGRHAGAHHALHGRGRAAVRPARGDGRRPDRRRGLAAGAHRAALHPRGASSCASAPRTAGAVRGQARRHRRAGRGAARPDPGLRRRRRRGASAEVHDRRLRADQRAGAAQHAGGRVPAPDRPDAGGAEMGASGSLRSSSTTWSPTGAPGAAACSARSLLPLLFLVGDGRHASAATSTRGRRRSACPTWTTSRPGCSPRPRCRSRSASRPGRCSRRSTGTGSTTRCGPRRCGRRHPAAGTWPSCCCGSACRRPAFLWCCRCSAPLHSWWALAVRPRSAC